VQTWTVIRGQDDFRAVAENLAQVVEGFPPCPAVGEIDGDVNALISARNDLQHWLSSVLMYPGARESPAVRNFLTYAANMIPPQYENVPWTMFAANGQVTSYSSPNHSTGSDYASGNLDDMVMDDMFDVGDDVGPVPHEDTDDEEDYRPSVRYKPTDEPITEEDEMDIAQMAGEVEMIEDVGSLAQSLGASHLGRSIRLQEEMAGAHGHQQQQSSGQPQTGLQMGTALSGASSGGIGSAMKNAAPGLGGSFNQKVPESAPRLDAFKMIKVIGKGSFGEY
jgi:hypothetical protein